MSSRLLVLVLVVFAATASAGPAQAQQMTKREVIVRMAEICKHGREAMATHVRRAETALRQRRPVAFARHGRRWARAGMRHLQRMRDLREPRPGNFWLERYMDRTRGMFGWVDLAMDAYAERRYLLSRRRTRRAERHRERAQKAAREYGLRRVCVRFLEA